MKYNVQRSTVIKTTSRKAYALARDMNQAELWSPWFVMDASAKPSVTGDGKKVGSIHHWDTPLLGAGEQEIVELKTDKLIRHELRFLKPFKSQAIAAMTFKKVQKGVKVTWRLDSSLPFFMAPMKKMFQALIGMDYDRGLSMMKQLLEDGAVHTKVTYEGAEEAAGFSYVGIKTKTTTDKCPKTMGRDFAALEKFVIKNNIKIQGAFSIYHKYDIVKGGCVYTAGLMVKDTPKKLPKGITKGTVKGGKAFKVLHKGSYLNLGNAWTGGMMYIRANKLKARKSADPVEVYLNHPGKVQPKNLRTAIYFPVK